MLSRTRTILLELCLTHDALATTFRPNCTTPPEGSNYVAGLNVRSTLSIFWSAIYTIFVCTWAIQHLNVPAQDQKRDGEQEPNGDQKIKWWQVWRIPMRIPASFWTKVKWMLVTIVLPEFLVGRALGDWIAAHRFARKVKDKRWSVAHGFYADSGGILLQPPIEQPGDIAAPSKPDIDPDINHRRAPSDLENQLPAAVEAQNVPYPIALSSIQLQYLLPKEDLIDPKPPITKSEIEDKSNGDYFAKLSALIQILWLVTQVITRKVLNLRTTQLEISALSFAICAFVTHVLWWEKPQNIQIPTDVVSKRKLWSTELNGLQKRIHSFFKNGLLPWIDEHNLAATIPNDQYKGSRIWESEYGWFLAGEDVGFVVGAVILGACHCIAWNFDFPTPIERTLWRGATIAITGVMPTYYLLWLFLSWLKYKLRYKSSIPSAILAWLAYTAYIVPRLYLLVAAFRDLFYLPPEAFVTTWSVSFPHFG